MAASNNFDMPANEPVTDRQGNTSPRWAQWLTRINAIGNANIGAGVTADRPTKNLWIGRRYFDTTLGKPVFLKTISVPPTPNVWVDGVGTVS